MAERMVMWQLYGPLITRIFRSNRQTPASRESVEDHNAAIMFEESLKEGAIHEWYPPDECGHAQTDGTTNPVQMWKNYLEDLGEGTTALPLPLRMSGATQLSSFFLLRRRPEATVGSHAGHPGLATGSQIGRRLGVENTSRPNKTVVE